MSIGPRRLGKYELRERLGRGGMAEVWKAMDTQLQRYVAIKFLHADLRTDPNFMTRFVREAQAVASLRHPNIVQLHDFQTSTESDNTAYMVMNYIEGPTLAEYIRDTSRLGKFPPFADIIYLFSAISSAIDYAHQRGMIHRDIKPSNIMLDQRNAVHQSIGKPVLMDFGIVKLMGSFSHTLTGSFMGTPHYMSPEQALGRQGDGRSDIYSLGVILYEICTGVRPFQGDNPSVILMQHINAMPPSPGLINPNIPPALTNVILRSLAKDPAARFSDASTMTLAMAEALNMSPPANVSSTQGYKTPAQSNLPLMPSSSSLPNDSMAPYVMGSSTPQFPVSASDRHHTPATPSTGSNSLRPSVAVTPVFTSPTPISPQKPAAKKKQRMLLVISLIMLILVLSGASLAYFYLFSNPHATTNLPNPVVGHAFFVSNPQVNELNSQGIEDEMRIDLTNVANPPAGKSYYAWLLGDKDQTTTPFLLLGRLTVDAGNVTFSYLHDSQYTDLLQYYSQFLITKENSNSTPTHPSSGKHAWVYYAELPQMRDGTLVNSDALDQIRLLLVKGGNVPLGIGILFLRSAYQVLTLSNSARDSWNKKDIHTLRDQIIGILDYIDSAFLVQKDVPVGTPLTVDAQFVQVPLLDFSQGQNPVGYTSRLDNLLNALLSSPGITPTMKTLATQALNDLPRVQDQLSQVYKDAVLLVRMNDKQLLQPSVFTTLNDMATAANFAYNVMNLSTNEPQGGAFWIYTQIQNLATFDVQRYTAA